MKDRTATPNQNHQRQQQHDEEIANLHPYAAPFRDWKEAQRVIKQSMREEQEQQRRSGARSSRHQPPQEEALPVSSKREKRTRPPPPPLVLSGTEEPATENAQRSLLSSSQRTSWKQREKCVILILAAIALVSTVAVITLPFLLFRRSAMITTLNGSVESTTAIAVTVETKDDTSVLDPRIPQGDLVYPNLPQLNPVAPPVALPTWQPTPLLTFRPTRSPLSWAPILQTTTTLAPSQQSKNRVDELFQLEQHVKSFVTVDAMHFEDEDSPYAKAWIFLSVMDRTLANSDNIAQRFGMALLNAAVGGAFADPTQHECLWQGVTCTADETIVHKIEWPNYDLQGHLPHDIGLVMSHLETLDLADNQLWGTIPDTLYTARRLQYLYLHQNSLSGTLSESIAQLSQLKRLYLSSNYFSGTLPQGLGSRGRNIRALEYLSLYDNYFTGTIPSHWNLRNLFYLDVGKNRLSGTFPDDWVNGRNALQRVRVLYVDENTLRGTLPSALGTIGHGRLQLLSLHTNTFSGQMPGFYNHTSFLNILEMHHNPLLTSMDAKGVCRQVVFHGGEMVMLRADCGMTCRCQYFCAPSWCY